MAGLEDYDFPTYHGSAEHFPAALAYLGEPESVHLAATENKSLGDNWVWYLVVGGTLALIPLGVATIRAAAGWMTNPHEMWVHGGLLFCCLIITAIPTMAVKGESSYWIFPDALVRHRRGVFTVVFWKDIEGLHQYGFENDLHLKGGGKFALSTRVENDGDFIQRVHDRCYVRKREAALGAIERGGWAEFGDVRVSKEGLDLNGKLVPWEDVVSVTRWVVNGAESLTVRESESGHILPHSISLFIPHRDLLLECVTRCCPAHLLKKATSEKPTARKASPWAFPRSPERLQQPGDVRGGRCLRPRAPQSRRPGLYSRRRGGSNSRQPGGGGCGAGGACRICSRPGCLTG